MSLDNTSQLSVKHCADKVNAKYINGRPEPELVPSRYALKVGEIDVNGHALSSGAFSGRLSLWPKNSVFRKRKDCGSQRRVRMCDYWAEGLTNPNLAAG
jgi:hypothetical protein